MHVHISLYVCACMYICTYVCTHSSMRKTTSMLLHLKKTYVHIYTHTSMQQECNAAASQRGFHVCRNIYIHIYIHIHTDLCSKITPMLLHLKKGACFVAPSLIQGLILYPHIRVLVCHMQHILHCLRISTNNTRVKWVRTRALNICKKNLYKYKGFSRFRICHKNPVCIAELLVYESFCNKICTRSCGKCVHVHMECKHIPYGRSTYLYKILQKFAWISRLFRECMHVYME